MKKEVQQSIEQLKSYLINCQSSDGSWRFCCESTTMTDTYMIILLRSLEMEDEKLIKQLVNRLLMQQNEFGAWTAYPDEKEGNLSATIEAYTALLFSGYIDKQDEKVVKAKRFIQTHGGIDGAAPYTKMMLAMIGEYHLPEVFPVPTEIILLPSSFPINFYDFSVYARAHMVPTLIAWDKKFHLRTDKTPDLSELAVRGHDTVEMMQREETRSILSMIQEGVHELKELPAELHQQSLEKLEQYMLDHIEVDGTLYSYESSTFLMIFALLALGYPKNDPIIRKAINGIKAFICQTKSSVHVQNFTSTVWDTALISYALQEAGMSTSASSIKKSIDYLLNHQQDQYGDWAIHNPHTKPGGWGFSDINTMNPDVDDTTAALRALRRYVSADRELLPVWNRGVKWVLSMQNSDGGWAAFEKNTDKHILTLVPIDGADAVSIDPSTADLTGRALEFLGSDTRLPHTNPQIKSGVNWLRKNQTRDGSWYGRWGVCYIYGTWAAISGMRAVGVSADDPCIEEAVQWLLNQQNEDGGWGESCQSDVKKHYVPLGASVRSQTAWALDALISVSEQPTAEMNRGVSCLIQQLHKHDWTTTYPTGAGLPGHIYMRYHSYNVLWPLLALSHYLDKYGG